MTTGGTMEITGIPPEWKDLFKKANIKKRELQDPKKFEILVNALATSVMQQAKPAAAVPNIIAPPKKETRRVQDEFDDFVLIDDRNEEPVQRQIPVRPTAPKPEFPAEEEEEEGQMNSLHQNIPVPSYNPPLPSPYGFSAPSLPTDFPPPPIPSELPPPPVLEQKNPQQSHAEESICPPPPTDLPPTFPSHFTGAPLPPTDQPPPPPPQEVPHQHPIQQEPETSREAPQQPQQQESHQPSPQIVPTGGPPPPPGLPPLLQPKQTATATRVPPPPKGSPPSFTTAAPEPPTPSTGSAPPPPHTGAPPPLVVASSPVPSFGGSDFLAELLKTKSSLQSSTVSLPSIQHLSDAQCEDLVGVMKRAMDQMRVDIKGNDDADDDSWSD